MKQSYQTIYQGGIGEIEEKKSRFIASVAPVESEKQAMEFLTRKKKEYYNATHNCYAYIIGKSQEIKHCSDDGEPSKTAGMPILDVLEKRSLCNVIVVVTRYFGGTLLGTGGLVRAYSDATKEGLAHCVIIEKKPGLLYQIQTDYSSIGKIKHLAQKEEIQIQDTFYTKDVLFEILLEPDTKEAFLKKISQITAGMAIATEKKSCYFAKVENKVLIFEE